MVLPHSNYDFNHYVVRFKKLVLPMTILRFLKNKSGLAGRFKILGQIIIGIVVGLVMVFHPEIVIKQKVDNQQTTTENKIISESSFTSSFQKKLKKPLKQHYSIFK